MVTQHAENVGKRGQVERLVEVLGAYSSSVLTARLLEEATGGELTPAQFEALTFIHRHQAKSVKDLSAGLRISIPSATRLVDRLVAKRLVHRGESGVDRRLVELSATRTGEEALIAVERARLALLQRTLDALPEDERETLMSLLERFLLAALCDERTVDECCLHCGTEHDAACVVNMAHLALVGRPVSRP